MKSENIGLLKNPSFFSIRAYEFERQNLLPASNFLSIWSYRKIDKNHMPVVFLVLDQNESLWKASLDSPFGHLVLLFFMEHNVDYSITGENGVVPERCNSCSLLFAFVRAYCPHPHLF